MPEVQARRHLRGRIAALSVLAPVGSFAGKGALRVLRVSFDGLKTGSEENITLVCGYESYRALDRLQTGAVS